MTRLVVVTWNAEGMFVAGTKTRRATPHDALAVLRELDADIVAIPEFGRVNDVQDEIATTIRSLGYEMVTYEYDEPRSPGMGFALLSRFPIHSQTTHDLGGGRSFLEIICHQGDIPLRVIGVHLDDKTERSRLSQVKKLSTVVNARASERTLLLGDFNAMARSSVIARLARHGVTHRVTRRLRHALIQSMASRVQEMALGTTIEAVLATTKLHDLDPGHHLTISGKQSGLEWFPAIKLAKIDWIFGGAAFTAKRYTVWRDVGSDHRPVQAELEY